MYICYFALLYFSVRYTFFITTRLILILTSDNYRPAKFYVNKIIGPATDEDGNIIFYAEGLIDQKTKEELSLRPFIKQYPRDETEFRQLFPGDPLILDVLYNPTAIKIWFGNEYIPVQKMMSNFINRQKKGLHYALIRFIPPLVLGIFLIVMLWRTREN